MAYENVKSTLVVSTFSTRNRFRPGGRSFARSNWRRTVLDCILGYFSSSTTTRHLKQRTSLSIPTMIWPSMAQTAVLPMNTPVPLTPATQTCLRRIMSYLSDWWFLQRPTTLLMKARTKRTSTALKPSVLLLTTALMYELVVLRTGSPSVFLTMAPLRGIGRRLRGNWRNVTTSTTGSSFRTWKGTVLPLCMSK